MHMAREFFAGLKTLRIATKGQEIFFEMVNCLVSYSNCRENQCFFLKKRSITNWLVVVSNKHTFVVMFDTRSDEVEIGGFAPHIDAVAYTHVKMIKHLTILLAVDASNMTNGGLEVVDGSHMMQVPVKEDDHCLETSWVESQTWTPVELEPGKICLPFALVI